MADDKYKAGLGEDDDLSQYPSPVSPLNPEEVDKAKANPDLLKTIASTYDFNKGDVGRPGPMGMPSGDKPSAPASVVAAGKLGGAGAAPSPSDTQTPSTDQPSDAHGYGMAGLGLLNKALQGATDTTGQMSTAVPPEIAKLTAQQQQLETKTPLRDAQGNILSQYKASTGQKVWRGVRGGLIGLATGGIPGALVGSLEPQDISGGTAYGAPNKQYGRAEDTRQQQLAATGEELKTAQQNWKDAVDAAKAKTGEYRANAALGKDLTTGATALINAENKPETEENKTKAKVKLSQQEFDQRSQQLQADPNLRTLSPLQKALYMANGKLPDPREPNEADVQAANMARALVVFQNSHSGRKPATLEEFSSVISSAKGELDKGKGGARPATPQQLKAIEDKKAAGIEKANTEFARKQFLSGASQEYQRQLQEIEDNYEVDMSLYDRAGTHNVVTVDPKGHVTRTPEAAAPAPQAPPGGIPGAGEAKLSQQEFDRRSQQLQADPNLRTLSPLQKALYMANGELPDGTRRQAPNGTIEIKSAGKWVKEGKG